MGKQIQAHLILWSFSLLCFTGGVLSNTEGKTLHQRNITTHFVVLLRLLLWFGTEPTIPRGMSAFQILILNSSLMGFYFELNIRLRK